MVSIVETSTVPHTPERLWEFFVSDVEQHYESWHREHLRWRWLSGVPLSPGSVWFADEWVGRTRIAARFRVHRSDPCRFFNYRILGWPSSVVRAGGSFRFELAKGGARVVQSVDLGFSAPPVGTVIDLLIRAAVPLGDIRRHMREEQENLPRLLSSVTAKGG
jgi:Polyketide cyclase / dehydrase and lipid transport